ncbi:hypothetical protein GMDG_07156 [Pseudogymnoascus destructans 20631-21]|uniref:Uncharacterized protein n=1 Tax=Pseudogymnoascus destructans (strain ATCC MYA-4855 / 20631-21) TaxID=658429 RepID=L8FX71_PSED2|nr:hypothetical protein GMDG_07156 [Pseudogymnoascus destructans 20631-21]
MQELPSSYITEDLPFHFHFYNKHQNSAHISHSDLRSAVLSSRSPSTQANLGNYPRMAELIGFGLSASDKLIDKLTSPMGKDIPYITEKLHAQTGTNTEHNPHRRFRSPDSDPDSSYSSDTRTCRSHHDNSRSRHKNTRDRDSHAERPRRQRAADMREDSPPNSRHVHVASLPPQRPGFVTRGSQSQCAPRRASRRGDERRGSTDRRGSRSRSNSSEGIAERFMEPRSERCDGHSSWGCAGEAGS